MDGGAEDARGRGLTELFVISCVIFYNYKMDPDRVAKMREVERIMAIDVLSRAERKEALTIVLKENAGVVRTQEDSGTLVDIAQLSDAVLTELYNYVTETEDKYSIK